MIVSQIAAMSKNRVIGKNNQLPWHMPDDLAYFFRMTRHRHIIMGRRNFEANGKALPNRLNIVITRNRKFTAPGCMVFPSVEEALQYSLGKGEEEVFIVGGGSLYQTTLDFTDRIYLTLIKVVIDGDVFFPVIDPAIWEIVSEEKHKADDRNPFDYTFLIYERLNKNIL